MRQTRQKDHQLLWIEIGSAQSNPIWLRQESPGQTVGTLAKNRYEAKASQAWTVHHYSWQHLKCLGNPSAKIRIRRFLLGRLFLLPRLALRKLLPPGWNVNPPQLALKLLVRPGRFHAVLRLGQLPVQQKGREDENEPRGVAVAGGA